jgi:glucokinase
MMNFHMTRNPSTAIGVDIGGTSTKMGVVTLNGQVLWRDDVLTPHNLKGEAIMQTITAALDGIVTQARQAELELCGIGVSVCGYMEPSGDAPDYINLHPLDHYPIRPHFMKRYDLPVVLDNDMNCGVLGEYFFGGGRGEKRLMVMTVGTGVGMAVILNGQVMRFHGGTVGNPGHLILDPNGPTCTAGCKGCLESLASAGPIGRRAEDMARSQRPTLLAKLLVEKGQLTPKDLYLAAEAGDIPAQEIWDEVGRWLGRGLASWVEIFGPEVVIVGGGVAQAGHWLIDPIEVEMRRMGEPYFTKRVREIKQSTLGMDIAMLGAAALSLFPENAPQWL